MLKKKYLLIYLIIVLLFSAFYFFIGSTYNLNIYDEGISLFNAKRVSEGEIPYKDFWTVYSPGIFYFYSIVFSVFGESVVVARLATILFLVVSSFFVYLLSARIGSWWSAFISLLVFVLFSAQFSFSGKASLPAFTFILISVNYIAINEKARRDSLLFFAGISGGIVFLFRYDFAIYFVLAVLVFYLIKVVYGRGIRQFVLEFMLFSLGFLVVAIPVVIYFGINVPAEVLYSVFVEYPLKIYPEYRGMSVFWTFAKVFESNSFFSVFAKIWEFTAFWLPLILIIFVFVRICKKYVRIGSYMQVEGAPLVILYSVIALIFYSTALVRFDIEHLFTTISFAIVLLSYVCNEFYLRKSFVFGFVVLLCFFLAVPVGRKIVGINRAFNITGNYYFETKALKGISAEKRWAEDYDKVIKFVQEATKEDDYIFVGNLYHDKIFVNDLMLYFAIGRKCATRFSELHPGVATTLRVQNEIVNDLRSKKVKYIVLCEFESVFEPNSSCISSNVFSLDEFIRKNYILERQFGNYRILKKLEGV